MKWSIIGGVVAEVAKQAVRWLLRLFKESEHEKRQKKHDEAMEDPRAWFHDHFQSDRVHDPETRSRDSQVKHRKNQYAQ